MSRMLARKGLMAAAATLGILAFATASPASADPVQEVTGLITVGDEEFPVDGEGETECGETALEVDFSGNASTGTWTTGGTIKAPFQVSGSSAWFQAEITLSGSGNYLPFDGQVLAQVVLQDLNPSTCAKVNKCEAVALLIVDSSSSVTGGTLPNPTSVNLIADSSASGGVPLQLLGNCGATLAGALGNQQVFADLGLAL